MDINEEIRQSAEKLSLTLDTPESVKQQIKQITLAQKQLRAVKKKLSATIRSINQQAAQSSADSLGSIVFDIVGKRKVAGSLRADKRRAVQRSKQKDREPYLDLKAVIDELILEGDRLKILADEYLLDPEGVKARLQAEEERKRQEEEKRRRKEEERRREEEERKRQQEEAVKTLLQIPKKIFLQLSQLLDAPLNNNQWLKKQAANLVEQGRMTSQYNALRFLKSWAKSLFWVTAILLGLLLLSPVNGFFSYFLFLALLLLFLLSPIALIVGLIRPSLVIPTTSPTRIKALITYGLATVLFFVLLGFSSLLVPQQTANQATNPSTSSPNLESPTPPPSPSPSPSLTPQQRAAEKPEVEQPSQPGANSTLDRNTLPSGNQQSSRANSATEAATVTSEAVLTATDPNSQINLRETPSLSGKRLGYGLVGDRVGIIEKKTGDDGSTWYLVKFPRSGAQGWIREDFVTLNGTSQPPEVSPSPVELSTPSESPTPEIGSPIRSSISGNCQCPYDTDSQGRQCGARSAYSRPDGGSPQCYVGE